METFFQHLLNGLSLGAIYALIALGYTLVYGILRLINFAHGDIFMAGTFAGLYAAQALGAGQAPSLGHFGAVLLIAMAAAGLLGWLVERLAYRPLRQAPRVNLLMTAVGVSLLLENLGQVVFGATPRLFPDILPESTLLQAGAIAVTNHQAAVLATSLGLMLVLEWVIHSTRFGRAMRAVSHSHEAASLVGIPVDRIIAATFVVGSALAAAAGILLAVSYPKVDPLMGILPGMKAFVAAVLGGIGNIRGAVVGALLMGVAEELVAGYFSSTYRDALAFGILILILLVKPAGLFGKYEPEKV
jgi:branched-chain amino acid transport system permease protein